eukprot:PhF_6_TR6859/c0_g1_i2/m.9875
MRNSVTSPTTTTDPVPITPTTTTKRSLDERTRSNLRNSALSPDTIAVMDDEDKKILAGTRNNFTKEQIIKYTDVANHSVNGIKAAIKAAREDGIFLSEASVKRWVSTYQKTKSYYEPQKRGAKRMLE